MFFIGLTIGLLAPPIWFTIRGEIAGRKAKALLAKIAAEDAAYREARERARMFPPARTPWNDHERGPDDDYHGKGL